MVVVLLVNIGFGYGGMVICWTESGACRRLFFPVQRSFVAFAIIRSIIKNVSRVCWWGALNRYDTFYFIPIKGSCVWGAYETFKQKNCFAHEFVTRAASKIMSIKNSNVTLGGLKVSLFSHFIRRLVFKICDKGISILALWFGCSSFRSQFSYLYLEQDFLPHHFMVTSISSDQTYHAFFHLSLPARICRYRTCRKMVFFTMGLHDICICQWL